MKATSLFLLGVAIFGASNPSWAATPNRITRAVDVGRTRTVKGNLHRLAKPEFDRGPVDPGMRMDYMLVLTKASTAQQADLDQLLADQQNPSSPRFRQWLTPEEFGSRFGLSTSDHSKIAAWLRSEGFTVNELARGRNWVAFSGTAGRVSKALHTSIHRFEVSGKMHYANAAAPAIPEALADVVDGFLGLDDFVLQPMAKQAPYFNSGTNHYLVPEDYATIYNIAPLYRSGLDGTGVSIAVVGASDVLLTDLQAFKKRYNLPANDPKMVNYSGLDPGFNGAQLEGNLDLEWASAIAPKATIYYVYGQSPFAAVISAVNANYAPIISISYGGCEVDYSQSYYRSVAQQGNAQGITILAASGDSGGAGCDSQGVYPFAEHGQMVDFPAVMPEVTGVGGTQFAEGTGNYWASTNTANFGSALSYIPEKVWNESATGGLLASGGGNSQFYSRPAWQNAPGVPADNARHVPDVSLSAAAHDGYEVTYFGATTAVSGTSASAPSMAGIVALLNQYQIANKFQTKPGLGNINPQLYRLAQSAPAVFHDIVDGDNIVRCGQASIDCATGTLGYAAGPGYDMATGLGSIDVNSVATQWNTASKPVTVTVSASNAKPTSNDTVTMTASVISADGKGTPTGTVSFSVSVYPLATATLVDGTASVTFPTYILGPGTATFYAQYSGDAAFSSAGAGTRIQIVAPTGTASIVPSFPNSVWPNLPQGQGLGWTTTMTLREVGGVAAMLTGFTIDGKSQPVTQYFPIVNILPNGSISGTFVLRNLAPPTVRTYGFTGTDAMGNSWSREVSVNYNSLVPYSEDIFISATPLVVAQDPTADPSCQWPVQIHLDDQAGYLNVLSNFYTDSGGVNLTATSIVNTFGTTRVDAYGSLSGTLCFGGITPPATQTLGYVTSSGFNEELNISFTGPSPTPTKLVTASPSISLAAAAGKSAQGSLQLGILDKTQAWTASIYPANRTTSWLTLSQFSGVGATQLNLTANGAGFEPGAYRANIVLQCVNATPQSVTVPVMFLLGGSTSGTAITGVGNAASYKNQAAPGMILTVYGTKLANTTGAPPGTSPLPYATSGVTATVNGVAAPLLYVSPGQINLQIPYSTGAGPAVLGINNNGEVAGFQFNVAPSAPGIFSDASGAVVPASSVAAGSAATVYLTGAGEISPQLKTAYLASVSTYKPILPVSVSVGGVPAFIQFYGLTVGTLGTTQVNFTVPSSLTPGTYPVVVTVGSVASPPVSLTVTAPAAK
jgi:uncharacterized protein (TIGR03437 family)